MPCPEYLPLKKKEIYAWTAYNYARHSKTDSVQLCEALQNRRRR